MADAAGRLRAQRAEVIDDPALQGADLRRALVVATDAWLRDRLGTPGGVALVAVGGYGRRDPAPGSDLDLVLLHDGSRDVTELAERLWYPIWDAGVGLDHSVRTATEAVRVAREDLKAAVGLLDARLLAGSSELYDELVRAVRADWRAQAQRRLPDLAAATRARWEGAGEVAFLLEPDLKEARGGLRDVNLLRAVAAAWVGEAPSADVSAAEQVLLDVRCALHRRTGRGGDRLLLQEQDGVAAALGHTDSDELAHVVAHAGRVIAFAADAALRRVDQLAGSARRWGRGNRAGARRPLAEGVVEAEGEVALARGADPAADPGLAVRAASAAAQRGLHLGPGALTRLATEAAALAEPWPRDAVDSLLVLLGAGAPAVPVIEALDQAGLWERMLPEWAAVRSRPQRNAVHRFTVDRHLLETAAAAASLTRDVARPDLLLLSGLLHDIGKGQPGDHSVTGAQIAHAVAVRLGLAASDAADLATLVRHHLLLADTATRRDLDDPATTRAVASAVGSREVLEVLHALTVADAQATGPAAWSDWKAGLVRELVERTSAELAGAPPPAPRELTAEERELVTRGEFAVLAAGPTVTVMAPDRPGLLSRTAGVLALHRLDVSAASASSHDGMAVTRLEAHPRFGSPPDWALVRADLRRAFEAPEWLAHRLAARERDYAAARGPVAPPRVLLVDDASDRATVVEVRAHDRLGLLHGITRVLAAAGLDVIAARVSTLGAEAVDAFYVVTGDGEPLTDPVRRERLVAALLEAAA